MEDQTSGPCIKDKMLNHSVMRLILSVFLSGYMTFNVNDKQLE